MPVLHQGDLTIFTPTEEAQLKMQEFERKAIQENMIVDQHTASLIDEQKEQQEKNTKPGYLKIHKLMKLIASGGKDTMLASLDTISTPEMQTHSASSSNTASTTTNNNIKLIGLMKKIVNPTFTY